MWSTKEVSGDVVKVVSVYAQKVLSEPQTKVFVSRSQGVRETLVEVLATKAVSTAGLRTEDVDVTC